MDEARRPATMREAFGRAVENLRLGYPMRHELFLSRLTPVRYEAGVLTVAAADERVLEICERRLHRLLTAELAYTAGRDVRLAYVLAGSEGGGSC